jgi:hypothetical protein
MIKTMPVQQRGITFGGFIFGAFLLVLLSITGLKLIPPYIQATSIKNIFQTMARDPELQKASPHDIHASFVKYATIDNITAIKAEDIDISSDDGGIVFSASYEVKVPLMGNISFLLSFNPSSASK